MPWQPAPRSVRDFPVHVFDDGSVVPTDSEQLDEIGGGASSYTGPRASTKEEDAVNKLLLLCACKPFEDDVGEPLDDEEEPIQRRPQARRRGVRYDASRRPSRVVFSPSVARALRGRGPPPRQLSDLLRRSGRAQLGVGGELFTEYEAGLEDKGDAQLRRASFRAARGCRNGVGGELPTEYEASLADEGDVQLGVGGELSTGYEAGLADEGNAQLGVGGKLSTEYGAGTSVDDDEEFLTDAQLALALRTVYAHHCHDLTFTRQMLLQKTEAELGGADLSNRSDLIGAIFILIKREEYEAEAARGRHADDKQTTPDAAHTVAFTATLSAMSIQDFHRQGRGGRAWAAGDFAVDVATGLSVPRDRVRVTGAGVRAGSVIVETSITVDGGAEEAAALASSITDPAKPLVDEFRFGPCAVSGVRVQYPAAAAAPAEAAPAEVPAEPAPPPAPAMTGNSPLRAIDVVFHDDDDNRHPEEEIEGRDGGMWDYAVADDDSELDDEEEEAMRQNSCVAPFVDVGETASSAVLDTAAVTMETLVDAGEAASSSVLDATTATTETLVDAGEAASSAVLDAATATTEALVDAGEAATNAVLDAATATTETLAGAGEAASAAVSDLANATSQTMVVASETLAHAGDSASSAVFDVAAATGETFADAGEAASSAVLDAANTTSESMAAAGATLAGAPWDSGEASAAAAATASGLRLQLRRMIGDDYHRRTSSCDT